MTQLIANPGLLILTGFVLAGAIVFAWDWIRRLRGLPSLWKK